jgi:hypothetical protein
MDQERREDTGGAGGFMGFLQEIEVGIGVGEVTDGGGDEVKIPEGRGLDRASALTHDIGEYSEVIGKHDAVAHVKIRVALEAVEGRQVVGSQGVNETGNGARDVGNERDILAELDSGVGA